MQTTLFATGERLRQRRQRVAKVTREPNRFQPELEAPDTRDREEIRYLGCLPYYLRNPKLPQSLEGECSRALEAISGMFRQSKERFKMEKKKPKKYKSPVTRVYVPCPPMRRYRSDEPLPDFDELELLEEERKLRDAKKKRGVR